MLPVLTDCLPNGRSADVDKDDHWPERSAESGAHPARREIGQHRVGCTGGNGTYHDKRICERKLGNWSGFGEIERALTEVEHFSVISHENQGAIARDLASSREFTVAADESLLAAIERVECRSGLIGCRNGGCGVGRGIGRAWCRGR